jgi:hypothetical protein
MMLIDRDELFAETEPNDGHIQLFLVHNLSSRPQNRLALRYSHHQRRCWENL